MSTGNPVRFKTPHRLSDWRLILSSAFFVFAVVIGICAIAQIVLFPFRVKGDAYQVSKPVLSSANQLSLKPLPDYQKDFETHALFVKPEPVISAVKGPDLDALLKPYVLIGIVQGISPEALIHDAKAQQTHFVRAGEQFNALTLGQIKERSIVLEYEGQKMEMHVEGAVQ